MNIFNTNMERPNRSNRSGTHSTRSVIPKTKGIKHERENSNQLSKGLEVIHKDFFNGINLITIQSAFQSFF